MPTLADSTPRAGNPTFTAVCVVGLQVKTSAAATVGQTRGALASSFLADRGAWTIVAAGAAVFFFRVEVPTKPTTASVIRPRARVVTGPAVVDVIRKQVYAVAKKPRRELWVTTAGFIGGAHITDPSTVVVSTKG